MSGVRRGWMRASVRALALLAAAACLAPDDTTSSDGGPGKSDGGPLGAADAPRGDGPVGGGVTVTITAPASGTSVHRDYLWRDGKWVARVSYTAQVSPAVAQVDWMAGGLVRGLGLPPDYRYDAVYYSDGAEALSAVVHDPGGGERGRADSSLTVLAPTAADKDCPAQLDALGVMYGAGPDTMGIPHPVTVKLPLKGIPITAAGMSTPRTSLVMDCPMALALWRALDVLADHKVTALTDAGLYIYRCVSGSEQPPCTQSGFSLHAYGQAFDIASLTTQTGLSATVKDDWVVDSGPTCGAPAGSAKNQLLHDTMCDLYMNGIFSVVLTPDFSATQPFVHMDLTPGQMVIK
jgi:hypothetical protein